MFDLRVEGTVVRGHGAASGEGDSDAYPGGTLAHQIPVFRALGIDLSRYFRGTINVDVSPVALRLVKPTHLLERVKWTPRIPPETFSFAPAEVEHLGERQPALVYYPHPETKVENFQSPHVLEFIAVEIPGLKLGDRVALWLDSYRFAEFYETDPYRPVFHLTPKKGWMNDPNGLVHDGERWHFFYQAYDPAVCDGMFWGHSVSRDLVRWEPLPPAILPDAHGQIWSGSALRTPQGLACFFTYFDKGDGGRQSQGLALSCDGLSYEVVGPVIPKLRDQPGMPDETDFRDPKVLWHAPTARYVMVVAGGKLRFYTSADLREWEFASWNPEIETECPDLFELPVQGEPGETMWVLSGGGDWVMFGDFDGTSFTPRSERMPYQHGPDGYAMQTFSDAPDGRRIAVSWLYSWKYGSSLSPGGIKHPFATSWAGGCQTVPVELSLVRVPEGLELRQTPIRELESLHQDVLFDLSSVEEHHWAAPAWDAEFLLKLGGGGEFDLSLVPDGDRPVHLHADESGLIVTRVGGGLAKVPGYEVGKRAPLRLDSDGRIRLRVLKDRCSLEVFAGEGETVSTTFTMTDPGDDRCELRCSSEEVLVGAKTWSIRP